MTEMSLIPQAVLPWSDADYLLNPYPWYAKARKENPIYLDMDGTYVLTRYEDVVKYGKLSSLSIREPSGEPQGAWKAMNKTVLNMDPPTHTAARRPLNKWFTPKLVKQWSEAGKVFVEEFLAGVKDGETFNAGLYLGVAPAHAAMCKCLQVPVDKFDLAIHSMHMAMRALSATATAEDDRAAAEGFEDLAKEVDRLIEYKRENPGDGMADALLAMADEGVMELEAVKQTLSLLWGSGGHNPSYVLGIAIEYWARHPEVYAAYKSRPEVRGPFLNEIYRLFPPELTFSRFTTEDIEIHGVNVKAGECIKFVMDSANRDPDIYPKPDEMDLTGELNSVQNMSFGMGAHQCAGQIISRGVIELVLNTLADMVESFELTGEPVMENTDRSRSYVDLPISVTRNT